MKLYGSRSAEGEERWQQARRKFKKMCGVQKRTLLSINDGNIVNIPSNSNAKKARATLSDKPAPPVLKSCFFKQFFQVI